MLLIIMEMTSHQRALQLSWRYSPQPSPHSPRSQLFQPSRHTVSFSRAHCVSISKVCTVLKLIMVMPATNALSEHCASVLQRVKIYLCVMMSQLHLNNLLIIHAPHYRTDAWVISSCLNDFVNGNEHRVSILG